MIQLQVDFSLLNKFFGVPQAKLPQYANKDFEEIMKLEAEQGNKKAAEYKKILSDPDKIYEIFKLSNVENKFIILQNMSEQDLDKLLPFLNEEQLAKGLQFFTDEKLLAMCKELPIEELAGMIFEKFTMFDVLTFMDDNAMNQFLMEPKVERKYAQSYFETLDKNTLELIMTQAYGKEFKDKDKSEYIDHLKNLNDSDYQNFMLSMERESKMELINGITQQEEKLLYLFEPEDLVAPMNILMKTDKIKMMQNLDPEFLVPMIQELPLDLTQIVLTQIDSREFSEIIAKDFEDILASAVLFSKG